MNKKIILLLAIYSMSLNAQTINLNGGEWTLVGVSEKASNMAVSSYINSTNVETIYTVVDGAGKSYNTEAPFIGAPVSAYQAFSDFKEGRGYWIKAKENNFSFTISGTPVSKLILNSGWNLVSVPSDGSVSDYISNSLQANGFSIETIYTVVDGAGKSYNTEAPFVGAPVSAYQAFSDFNATRGYWIKVSSIDYDVYIPNALTADTTLTTIPNQAAINGKSFLTAQNVDNSLKFYLTTVVSNNTYKKVELSSFTASTLNGTASDINTTINTQASSLINATGYCGLFTVENANDLSISFVDNIANINSSTSTTLQGALSSDGNLTIGSNYSKIVWSGDAINLDAVTTCTTTGMPTEGTPTTDISSGNLSDVPSPFSLDTTTGVAQKVVSYDGVTPTTVEVTLPVGTFDIYAEYTGKYTDAKKNIIQNIIIKDENNVTINDQAVSHMSLTNDTNEDKLYNVLLSQNSGAGDIWFGIIKDDFVNPDLNLTLGNVETNIGQLLVFNDSQKWSFETNSTQSGQYNFSITTDLNNTVNPLQNFTLELKLNGGSRNLLDGKGSTIGESLNLPLTLEAGNKYNLRVIGIDSSVAIDKLGSYKIKLIKQQQ